MADIIYVAAVRLIFTYRAHKQGSYSTSTLCGALKQTNNI